MSTIAFSAEFNLIMLNCSFPSEEEQFCVLYYIVYVPWFVRIKWENKPQSLVVHPLKFKSEKKTKISSRLYHMPADDFKLERV